MTFKFRTACYLFLLFTFSSCANSTRDFTASQLTTDTDQVLTNDTLIHQDDSETIGSIKLKKLTPEEKYRINKKIESDKEMKRKKALYGDKYYTGKDLEIIESKIIYDADYKPFLSIKLKNNLKFDFIAFEIIVNASSNCKTITLRKKIKIRPNESVSIKDKLDNSQDNCNFDKASIEIGDCILGNGDKIHVGPENDFFRDVQTTY